jgi:hypothetical protein
VIGPITSALIHTDIILATNMLSFYTIATVLIFHWVCDFFLQTDEQAKGKSTSNIWLSKHVATYSLGLLCITLLNSNLFTNPYVASIFFFVNVVAHFFTDYLTSRASSLLWKEGMIHDFFVMIGADQLIHYMTIFGTLIWLTSL